MNRVLVIDDEPAMGENIQRMLQNRETVVRAYTNPKQGLEQALAEPPDLLLLDMKMPEMSGEEVLARLHDAHPKLPVIFLTAFGSIEGAVLAMRNGAFDYLQKPFKREDLLLAVKRGLAQRKLEREVTVLRQRLEELGETDMIGSRSPAMQEQVEKARRAAATDATILILGESGTGKEVMARFIHDHSPHASGPFVPVECSAMPASLIESELFGYERGAFTGADRTKKGLIESSHQGTLFLDEIGDLSVELQTRLFRFVQERQLRRLGGLQPVKVNCRIVCATNQDLRAKIKAGEFREELYYRVGVVILNLPPLRGRREDIPYLASFFLERFSRRYGKHLNASPDFQEGLLSMPWPGNVRELKNLIERLTALHSGGTLRASDLADETPAASISEDLALLPWRDARERYLSDFEQSYAQVLLARCAGNVSAAARQAGVDRKTFYALLRREHPAQAGE